MLEPIKGWAKKSPDGLIIWSTFSPGAVPPDGGIGYYSVFQTQCPCEDVCDQWISDKTGSVTYSQNYSYTGSGIINMDFYYGALPVKYKIYKNNILLLDTGYGGLTSYQATLNTYLSVNGFPPETITTSPQTSYSTSVIYGDVIEIQVYGILNEKSEHKFRVSCLDSTADCVVSAWTHGAWSSWTQID